MTQSELVQLPNKDLWRGHKRAERAANSVEVITEELSPIDKAVLSCINAAKGASTIPCLWCGQGGTEPWVREHIRTYHKSIADPAMDGAVALADAANARAELAAATKPAEPVTEPIE